jgi:hypothetical protein
LAAEPGPRSTQTRVNSAIEAVRGDTPAAKVDGVAAHFVDASGAETVIAKLAAVDALLNNIGPS